MIWIWINFFLISSKNSSEWEIFSEQNTNRHSYQNNRSTHTAFLTNKLYKTVSFWFILTFVLSNHSLGEKIGRKIRKELGVYVQVYDS